MEARWSKAIFVTAAILFGTAGALGVPRTAAVGHPAGKARRGRPSGIGISSTVAARKLAINEVRGYQRQVVRVRQVGPDIMTDQEANRL